MQVYDEKVASEASVLGAVLKDWKNTRIFSFAKERKEFANDESNELLSISEYFGVAPRSEKFTESEGGSRDGSTIGYRIVKKNDLAMNYMLAWRGAQGVSKYNGIVSPAYAVYQLDISIVSPDFIHYLFRSKPYQTYFKSLSRGIMDSRLRLYPETFLHLSINIPEKKQQQKIADFLDAETAKIDILIAKQERLLELLEEKRRVTITQAVTRGLDPNVELKETNIPWLSKIPISWNVIMIKRLSEVKRGASPRPIEDPRYFDDFGEYSWVRIADVTRSGKYLEKTPQRLSTLGASLSVKREPGDIFVSIAASVGKPMITKIKCCIHDGFVYFPNLEGKMNFEFLWYIFTAGQCYGGLGKMGTQLNLNTETIGRIKIPLPSHKEQNSIVEFLNQEEKKFEQLKQKIQTQISLLRERRTSLISHATTGKVKI